MFCEAGDFDLFSELRHLKNVIVLGDKDYVKPTDPRLDRMVYKKADVFRMHGKLSTETFKVGELFRSNVDVLTMNHAMNIYAAMGAIIAPAGD